MYQPVFLLCSRLLGHLIPYIYHVKVSTQAFLQGLLICYSDFTADLRMRKVWRGIADMNSLESDNKLVTYHSWFACPLLHLQDAVELSQVIFTWQMQLQPMPSSAFKMSTCIQLHFDIPIYQFTV